jgi:hypothetical protein
MKFKMCIVFASIYVRVFVLFLSFLESEFSGVV